VHKSNYRFKIKSRSLTRESHYRWNQISLCFWARWSRFR